ncbi:ACSM2B isoform 8, partial [Pan troglodytes]
SGYVDNPDKTAANIRGDFWLLGDRGIKDEDGYFQFMGRAFVVLASQFLSHDPEQLTKELQQHVKSVTAPYKYPRKIEFVLNLPKTVTGKIQRTKLRDKEWKMSGKARAQ